MSRRHTGDSRDNGKRTKNNPIEGGARKNHGRSALYPILSDIESNLISRATIQRPSLQQYQLPGGNGVERDLEAYYSEGRRLKTKCRCYYLCSTFFRPSAREAPWVRRSYFDENQRQQKKRQGSMKPNGRYKVQGVRACVHQTRGNRAYCKSCLVERPRICHLSSMLERKCLSSQYPPWKSPQ